MINNRTITKWKTLFAALNVTQPSRLICSEAQIEQAEQDLGFRFPAGYKEFCQVFGSGVFQQTGAPTFFRFYCPMQQLGWADIRSTGIELIYLKENIEEARQDLADDDQLRLPVRLLEDGYVFADTHNSENRFFWDLASYRDEDQSCDIYWNADQAAEDIRLVGRDLYRFVTEFCLGDGWRIMFGVEDSPANAVMPPSFFTAVEPEDAAAVEQSERFHEELFIKLTLQQALSDKLFLEKAVLRLNCSYNAPGQAEADCLQAAWSNDPQVEIEVFEVSRRRVNIPRVVTVTVTHKSATRQSAETLVKKMIETGKSCNCKAPHFYSEMPLGRKF